MNNSRTRLVKLLDSKLKLFEQMGTSLDEQKKLLEEKNFAAYRKKSDDVDVIVAKIKDIDYDLARCESNDDEIAELISTGKDADIRARLREAEKIAQRNHDLIDELSEMLMSVKGELKEIPGKNSQMSSASGHKTRSRRSPEHTRKTS